MITIMMHHYGMTLQEAVDFVGDLCKKSIDRFAENRARLPSWGPEIDKKVQVYVQGLAYWIVGSLHWSFDSERYFGKKGLQVKKSRTVDLEPIQVPEPAASANSPVATESVVRVNTRQKKRPYFYLLALTKSQRLAWPRRRLVRRIHGIFRSLSHGLVNQ